MLRCGLCTLMWMFCCRCPQYFFLPPQCSYVTDSRDACCQQARCNPSAFLTPGPGSFVTPTPAPNGNLTNVTPTNGGGFGGSGLPPSPSPSFGSFSNNPTHTLNPHTVGGIGGSGTPPVRHTTYDIFTGNRPPSKCRTIPHVRGIYLTLKINTV